MLVVSVHIIRFDVDYNLKKTNIKLNTRKVKFKIKVNYYEYLVKEYRFNFKWRKRQILNIIYSIYTISMKTKNTVILVTVVIFFCRKEFCKPNVVVPNLRISGHRGFYDGSRTHDLYYLCINFFLKWIFKFLHFLCLIFKGLDLILFKIVQSRFIVLKIVSRLERTSINTLWKCHVSTVNLNQLPQLFSIFEETIKKKKITLSKY